MADYSEKHSLGLLLHMSNSNEEELDAYPQSCAAEDSLLAPIQKIPVEIMACIFLECMPQLDLDYALSRNLSMPLCRDVAPHDQTRQALTTVCRRWKEVMYSTPEIWSTIILQDVQLPQLATIERWIALSKSSLLDIYAYPRVWKSFTPGELWEVFTCVTPAPHNRFPDIISLIRRNMGHVRRLFVPEWDPENSSMQELLGRENGLEAPFLREFVAPGYYDNGMVEAVGTVHAPRLEVLALTRRFFIHAFTTASYRNLRHLVISLDPSFFQFYHHVFPICCSLEILHLKPASMGLTNNMLNERQGRIIDVILPSLNTLQISPDGESRAGDLLKHLRVPSLRSMTISNTHLQMDNDHCSLHVLLSLFDQDLPRLTLLSFTAVDITGSMVNEVLKRVSQLESLVVSQSSLDAGVFNLLANQHFLHLKKISLHRSTFPMRALMRCIAARKVSDCMEVHINHCTEHLMSEEKENLTLLETGGNSTVLFYYDL